MMTHTFVLEAKKLIAFSSSSGAQGCSDGILQSLLCAMADSLKLFHLHSITSHKQNEKNTLLNLHLTVFFDGFYLIAY